MFTFFLKKAAEILTFRGAPTEAKRVGSIAALRSNWAALVRKQTRGALSKEIESSVSRERSVRREAVLFISLLVSDSQLPQR